MHEIIHVVEADAASCTFRHDLEIEVVAGRPLAAGYYFVLAATGSRGPKRAKRYFGPFQTRAEARLLLTSALSLGLADNERVSPTIAECRSTVRPSLAANDGCASRQASAWCDAAACAA